MKQIDLLLNRDGEKLSLIAANDFEVSLTTTSQKLTKATGSLLDFVILNQNQMVFGSPLYKDFGDTLVTSKPNKMLDFSFQIMQNQSRLSNYVKFMY
jgi:hypothetical protein